MSFESKLIFYDNNINKYVLRPKYSLLNQIVVRYLQFPNTIIIIITIVNLTQNLFYITMIYYNTTPGVYNDLRRLRDLCYSKPHFPRKVQMINCQLSECTL